MTRGGGIVLGHNTMADYTDAVANVVIDIAPSSGHRILMQIQPGWIDSGTDFFITDAGLVGSGDDDRRLRALFGERRPGIHPDAPGDPGRGLDRPLVRDPQQGQQRGLRQRLAPRGHRDRGNRPARARASSTSASSGPGTAITRLQHRRESPHPRARDDGRRQRHPPVPGRAEGPLASIDAGRGRQDRHRGREGDGGGRFRRLFNNRVDPDGRTLAGHAELAADPARRVRAVLPARQLRLQGGRQRHGPGDELRRPLGIGGRDRPFDAAAFLAAHPQYGWMDGLIRSRPTEPWVVFTSGEKP